MKKLFTFILLFTLTVFCEKRTDLPRYQVVTRVDDDVAEFLSIDLYVYQGSTVPLASSLSGYNPFEVVDFTTQSSADLRFEIKRYANSHSDDVVLGFTMWCDDE